MFFMQSFERLEFGVRASLSLDYSGVVISGCSTLNSEPLESAKINLIATQQTPTVLTVALSEANQYGFSDKSFC